MLSLFLHQITNIYLNLFQMTKTSGNFEPSADDASLVVLQKILLDFFLRPEFNNSSLLSIAAGRRFLSGFQLCLQVGEFLIFVAPKVVESGGNLRGSTLGSSHKKKRDSVESEVGYDPSESRTASSN